MNRTLVEVPGNEQWSEREGQPLGPSEIKALLTRVGVSVSEGSRTRSPPESSEICTNPVRIRKAVEEEPLEHSVPSGNSIGGSEPLNTDVEEETEEGEAIIVGAVGSAAPWFPTGWTNEVEVEFMIDTGCQVTILATSVFEKCVRLIR